MPRIRNPKPLLKKTSKGYKLLAPYRYTFIDPMTDDKAYVDIPAGFEYDGATDFGFLARKDADIRADALFHDYGYVMLGDVDAQFWDFPEVPFSLSRKDLDIIFERALAYDANEQSWRRNLAYTVISFVGAIFWARRKWLNKKAS
jgi:hypothetical protein